VLNCGVVEAPPPPPPPPSAGALGAEPPPKDFNALAVAAMFAAIPIPVEILLSAITGAAAAPLVAMLVVLLTLPHLLTYLI
jgi:hypothetical protein